MHHTDEPKTYSCCIRHVRRQNEVLGLSVFLSGESVNKFIGHHNHHAALHFDLIQN